MARLKKSKNQKKVRVSDVLEAELRTWWEEESSDWDELVLEGSKGSSKKPNDLYDDLPVIDSKAVARTSPIFERILGIRLDTKLIRPGGYGSFEDMLSDIIPKMELLANHQQQKRQL